MRGEPGLVGVVFGGRVQSRPAGQDGVTGSSFVDEVRLQHELGGGISVLGGGGAWRTIGRRERPSKRGMIRCAMASMGRCVWMGGEGTAERQSSWRYRRKGPW